MRRAQSGNRGPALAAALFFLAGCSTPLATGTDATEVGAADSSATRACPEQPSGAAAADPLAEVTLSCLGGGQWDLSRPTGLPTVVNVWATWCPPCRDEYPLLGELSSQATAGGADLLVIGIVSQDTAGAAGSFAADAGVDIPAAMDPDATVARAQGLIGPPVTWFIDADGVVVHRLEGAARSVEELRDLVDTHLGVRW